MLIQAPTSCATFPRFRAASWLIGSAERPQPMRITIELDQTDVEKFADSMDRSRKLARTLDESDVVEAAKHALNTLPLGSAPAYVRNRVVGVQRLILMLEDEAWALPDPERAEVLTALVYFSDPDDLIPDDVEVIGLFDDAIVLELVLRRLRHVLEAYAAFCAFRDQFGCDDLKPAAGQPVSSTHAALSSQTRVRRAGELARHRDELRRRMQRQSRRKLVNHRGES